MPLVLPLKDAPLLDQELPLSDTCKASPPAEVPPEVAALTLMVAWVVVAGVKATDVGGLTQASILPLIVVVAYTGVPNT